jgi:ubiquinone/menaquinone biosynthesis C-methylase UbiE
MQQWSNRRDNFVLFQYLQNMSFARLVDMGCGTGQLILELARLKPQAHFTGIDIDEAALERARQQACDSGLATKFDFIRADCLHTPLEDASVDVVILRALLHHIQDITLAFVEFGRVLRKEGYLLLQDGRRIPEDLFQEMNEELRQKGLPGEVHPGFDIEELTEVLNRHDFTVEQVLEAGTATFATLPYTTKVYATNSFLLIARKTGQHL